MAQQDSNYLYNAIYPGETNAEEQRYLNPATFNSFSGANILAIFNTRVITEVQAITYSIKREIAPVFTLGTANPLSFSSGKRGIAGSIVAVVFDRESLLSELVGQWGQTENVRSKIFGNISNIGLNQGTFAGLDANGASIVVAPDFATNGIVANEAGDYNAAMQAAVQNFGGVDQFNTTLNQALGADLDNIENLFATTRGFGVGGMLYADQIPPFNITISMLNEAGRGAQLDILGVKIMNEGQGFSVDDITNEKAYSFVAREVLAMRPRGFGQSAARNPDRQINLQ